MGEILTKTCFSTQSEPHTAKLCFSVVLKHFVEIHREVIFLVKSDYVRKDHWNTQKIFFFYMFEKGLILRKIWICLNNFFLSNL